MSIENEVSNVKMTKVRFWIILILCIIGILLSSELSYIFYKTNFLEHFAQSFCSISNLIDCDGVAQTSYALTLGVPNAIWGIVLYLLFLFLLFVDKIQEKFKNTIFDVFENPRSYIATIGLVSFCLSMVLAGISIFKIDKICVLCFCVYFVNLFIALIANSKGFFLYDIKTTIIDFFKGVKKYFILFLVVLIAFISALVYFDKSLVFSPKLKKEKQLKEFYEAKTNKYAVKGNILGKKDAPIKLYIYSDFNCPFCKVLNIMLHKAAKGKNVLVEDVNFPLDTSCNHRIGSTLGGHENSCLYARYAIAAKKQGYYWGAANVFFYNKPKTQDEIEVEFKKAHLDIDINQLHYDANSPETYAKLENDINSAADKGIIGTPVVEIEGIQYMGAMPYDDLVNKIDLALKRAKNK